jgi:hypothetical protein
MTSYPGARQLSRAETVAILESRLGRAPQDILEAAVVLEAWGGLPAEAALAAAKDIFESIGAEPSTADETRESVEESSRTPGDVLTMILALASLLAWTGPIQSELGASVFAQAVRLSVPLTLGVQWFLAARYLFDRWWIERLWRDRHVVAAIAVGGIAAAAAVGTAALLAVELTLLWSIAGLVLRRGRRPVVFALFGGATCALFAGAPVLIMLGLLFAALLVVLGTILRSAGHGLYRGRPWRVSLRASLMGVALGILLLSDASANFGDDPGSLALALLPAMLASFWGGWYLASMWVAVNDDLRGRPLAESAHASWNSSACRIAAGAAVRLGLTIGVLTPACAAIGAALGWGTAGVVPLCALGAFAFAALGASLLNAIERAWLGIAGLAAGCVVAVVVGGIDGLPAGSGLLAGAVVATLATLAAVTQLRRPAQLLASIVR